MELDELNQLEEKVKNLVDDLKRLKGENEHLKRELQQMKKESTGKNQERIEIKKRVTTLIELIDSLEDQAIKQTANDNRQSTIDNQQHEGMKK